jgi:hypothetical protein
MRHGSCARGRARPDDISPTAQFAALNVDWTVSIPAPRRRSQGVPANPAPHIYDPVYCRLAQSITGEAWPEPS